MNFRLLESEAALTYPEEIRVEAVKLSKTFSLLHPLSFLLAGITMIIIGSSCWLLRDYVNDFMRAMLCCMGIQIAMCVVIPFFVGRRVLLSRKEEILRIIQGGFNDQDKGRKDSSAN